MGLLYKYKLILIIIWMKYCNAQSTVEVLTILNNCFLYIALEDGDMPTSLHNSPDKLLRAHINLDLKDGRFDIGTVVGD